MSEFDQAKLLMLICDSGATWQIPGEPHGVAGPLQVVSVSDAARIAAEHIDQLRAQIAGEILEKLRGGGWQDCPWCGEDGGDCEPNCPRVEVSSWATGGQVPVERPAPGTVSRSLDTLRVLLQDRGWRLHSVSARYETWWHPQAQDEVTVPTDRQAGDFDSLYDRAARRLQPDPTRTPGALAARG